jgi:hypothetical protein
MRTYHIATITRSTNKSFPFAAVTPDGDFLVRNCVELALSNLYMHVLVRYNPQDQFCEYVSTDLVQTVMETVALCNT